MTRREMLVGLGGILATGTCPAVLNNVPLCLVGNLEVDKMETIVCDRVCSNMEQFAAWVSGAGLSDCALINKNEPNRYNMAFVAIVAGNFMSTVGRNRNGSLQSVQATSVYDADVRIGDVFYVFRSV